VTRRLLPILLLAAALSAAPPERIVSTAPSITELLYALGLGNRVVGVTRYCRYPPDAQTKPKIGDYTSPNLEAIAALRPDLVVVQNNPIHLADKLGALHLRVLEINQESIAAIYKSIHDMGAATGTQHAASQLSDSILNGLTMIRARLAPLPRVRMMFVVGRSPNRLDGLVVAGRASYLNEVIEAAGGENIFRDAVAGYPKVSLEEVMARNPDVIVDMGDMSDTVGVTDEHKKSVTRLWDQIPNLAAVKNHRVYAVASDIFVVPGPRVIDAAKAFAEMLHPGVAIGAIR
jgi:iron complex transport system substrate-binding protein